MRKQYTTLTRMALFALAGLFVSIQAGRAADDCLTKPNAAAPPGNHWYYRVDRTTHRECWYLAPEGRELRTHPVGPLAAEPVPVDAAPTQAKTVAAAVPLGEEELVPDEMTSSQAKTTEINLTASAIRGSAIPTSDLSIDPTLVSQRDDYAEEQSITHSEDGLKPAELLAAQRPPESPISLAQLSAIFAIWLGLAALIAPILLRPSAIRQPANRKAHDQRDTSIRRGIRRRPFKGTRTPRDATIDLESSMRLLLQEFQRRQRCSSEI
jgi:hypothetical protein